MTSYNEIAILAQVASSDQKAFGELFARHKDRTYTIALTYTEDPVVSEELVQDVFVRVWKNRHKLPQVESFPSWLYTITRNRALTALKKIAREGKRREELISYLPTGVSDAEQKVDGHYMQKLLEDALVRLSPQQRKVFELLRLQGYSREEVAGQLGLAPATVSVHLTIALRSVRAFLTSRMELSLLLLLLP